MSYRKAFLYGNNQPLSILQERNIEYEERTEILVVNSKDRNIVTFPNPSNYIIDIMGTSGRNYKNIKSVRLVSASIPDKNNIGQQPYLVLQVDEFNTSMDGTNSILSNGSVLIQLDKALVPSYFYNIKTDLSKVIIHEFTPPISKLSQLHIKIKDTDGNLISFGTDSGTPDKLLQHTLVFEIVTLLKKQNTQTRNVF